MADLAMQREFLAAQDATAREDIALVSPDMPLRANLSVLDNISLIPQYRSNLKYNLAADLAWALLVKVGYQDMHTKRDPVLDYSERFVAKLLRAAIAQPAILLIDRPAMLLPEVHYPPFLIAMLKKLDADLNICWIVDYQWNKALYDADSCYPEINR